MRRQPLIVSLIVATLLLVTAGIAMAQASNYPPGTSPTSETATADGNKGDRVSDGDVYTVTVDDTLPGSSVNFTADVPDGTTVSMPQFQAMDVYALSTVSLTKTSDATGSVSFFLKIPKGAANGTYTWRATGTGSDGLPFSISGSFVVDSSLPITGGNVTRGAALAVVALVVGAGLVLVGRRRSADEHAPVA